MKSQSKTRALVVLCGGLSLGGGSCESASVDDPSSAADGGLDGAARSDDGAPLPDSGTALDASSPSLDAGVGPESGGDEGYSCGEPETALGAACNACIETNCEPTWCACSGDPDDDDEGGPGSGCLHYVKCVEACVAADAGSPTACLTSLCDKAPWTSSDQQEGHVYLDCLVQYCASDCGQ